MLSVQMKAFEEYYLVVSLLIRPLPKRIATFEFVNGTNFKV